MGRCGAANPGRSRLSAGSKLVAIALLFTLAFTAKADLSRWIQDIASPSALQAVFFRPMPLPGGPIAVRRPPKETRPELSKLIAASPSRADLYALRASEDELQLDPAAAENDWKKYAELAADKTAANLSLADFYHRRIQPLSEIAALESIANWKAFERIQSVIADQALPPDLSSKEYRAWITRYPSDPAVYKRFFEELAAKKQIAEAQSAIADYRKAFPADAIFPIQAQASLAPDPARIYDENFQALWPAELVKAYFDQLKKTHALRRFLAEARAQIAARPGDIAPVARVFYYHQQQNNAPGSLRALYEYRQRKDASKSTWTADELWTLGRLFEGAHNYDEAARAYHQLYSIQSQQERALEAIANVLLAAPDQPIRLGSGDLSFYRDIAAMDSGPGFLNGILSLLFNSTGPQYQYATENQASLAYFHRAQASELISEIDKRFPNSPDRAALHAKLIEAYVTYGDDAGILRSGRAFLTAFSKSEQRSQVALAMADAYARQNQTKAEFAIYDDLLKEFAVRADNVPLGENMSTPGARSPEYARILERYVGRLVALKRPLEALSLYRREIDRNPNDPGLYERLTGFLDQNKMGAEAEQVYRKAMAQFQDRAWSHKLARWYLRRKQTAQFDLLTREVVKIFSGTEMESYLTAVGQGQPIAPVLYRQVNLYAHQRFPYDLMFVRNLLTAYGTRGTTDPSASEALLRMYWFYAPDLHDRFFELLSRTGKLKTELAALPKTSASANPAAARFAAEAEAWQCHFETAAPMFRAVAAEYPGEVEEQMRAASLYRSLADTETAANLELNVTKFAPRDSGSLARVGDIYADRDQFNRAAPFWNRIATVDPGKPDGYIEAATVYWDYYRFDDALRLIAEGRQKLNNPLLYTYEAGAIYENRREYDKAIHEYARGDGPARTRLVQLARRPPHRALVDDLTAKAASGPNAPLTAISLRTEVLNAQNRPDDLRQFLLTTASVTTSPEVLQFIDDSAAARGFDQVREQGRLRRIALATDPVERMQAQVEMVHYYEGRHNTVAAGRIVDDLYRANPTVLGVVRAAVDYHWRVKDFRRSVDLLAQAADKAQPAYRDPFTLEAARKATDSGDYPRARVLLASLLKIAPSDPRYVAAMADTYARQGDDTGLRDFFGERLKNEKAESAAGLRRALIPVLTRLKDYTGAVDQYIEVLNRYPEDEDLAREAALYGGTHGRAQQLVSYYENARKQSPKDFHWPMAQARIQSQLEDFPAAVAAYTVAADLRPDRLEFYVERAGLEERLLRFDEAAATYAKLYDLSYRNSQWMLRVAAVRARQGQSDAAVKALNTALIEGRPAKPEAFFAVAQKLESWNMLPQAKEYALKGVNAAGSALLTDYVSGAQTYVRVMTRMRQYDAAYRTLAALTAGKPLDPSVLQSMGLAVGQYFTPEEKSAFAAFIGTRLQTFLPAIQSGGLNDMLARALSKLPTELVALQTRRLQFGELGAQLEAYWKSLAPEAENRDSHLEMAAANFRLAGDSAGELRVLAVKNQQSTLSGPALARFAELVARNPQRADAMASGNISDEVRNAVANAALKNAPAVRALQAIAARGRGLPPVWTRAYTGLTGLYLAANTPAVNTAFHDALGLGAIGDKLGKPVNRDQQLAGDLWFYYGSRYGDYLNLTKQANAEDYRASEVESRPGSSDAYFQLAETYRQAGQRDRAMVEYLHALELNANRADAHDRLAVVLLAQGKRADAIAEFRAALNASARQQDERRVAESFWTDLETTLGDIETAKLHDALRADIDRVLRTYVRRNGNYRAESLLRSVGVDWMIDLSRSAPEPTAFLSALVTADWIPEAQRAAVYKALIDAARAKPEMEQDLRKYQIDFITYLVDHKRGPEAQPILAEIPTQHTGLEVRIAAQTNGLTALLNRYAADPDLAGKLEEIRNAATEIEKSGNHAAARQVLEFVYTKQIDARLLSVGVFTGLAEIRLEQGDIPAAVALLRRMTMIVGEPFDNLMDAAELLIRTGHSAEATPFLEQRVKAVPWDSAARVQLAKAQGNSDTLKAAALSSDATYDARVAAAKALAQLKAGPVAGTSTELVLLSEPSIAPASAEKPYFYNARIEAAEQSRDSTVKIRLLRAAIAVDPVPEKPKFDLIREAINAKRWQLAIAAATGLAPGDFAKGLAQAHESVGDLEGAEALYRLATADADVKRVQAALKLQAADNARRPVITQNLEQDHTVRPRLVGGIR